MICENPYEHFIDKFNELSNIKSISESERRELQHQNAAFLFSTAQAEIKQIMVDIENIVSSVASHASFYYEDAESMPKIIKHMRTMQNMSQMLRAMQDIFGKFGDDVFET